MILEVNHVHTFVKNALVNQISLIQDVLSYSYSKFQYDRFRTIRVILFNSTMNSFPTGLLGRVIKRLESQKIAYLVEDKREYPKYGTEVTIPDNMDVRNYQLEGVKRLVESKRGILQMPPGTGKTELMILLCKTLGLKTLWLTRSADLAIQTKARFEKRLDIPVGMIGDGEWDVKPITVAVINSLYVNLHEKQTLDYLKSINLLIVDECHSITDSGMWKGVIDLCPASFRYGCSATPFDRTDNASKVLIGCLGELVYEFSFKEAVDGGYIVPPEIIMISYAEDRKIQPLYDFKSDDPRMAYANWKYAKWRDLCIMNNPKRNALITQIAYENGINRNLPTLVLVVRKPQGSMLSAMLCRLIGHNRDHAYIHGSNSTFIRKEVIDAFKKGRYKIVIATNVFKEGIDIPQIQAIVIGCAGDAPIGVDQRLGRGLRTSADKNSVKETVKVYDFNDPQTTFCNQSLKRRVLYQNKGKIIDFNWEAGGTLP